MLNCNLIQFYYFMHVSSNFHSQQGVCEAPPSYTTEARALYEQHLNASLKSIKVIVSLHPFQELVGWNLNRLSRTPPPFTRVADGRRRRPSTAVSEAETRCNIVN